MDTGSELFKQINDLAEEAGFITAPLDPSILEPLPLVREMCAENKCHKYNSSWSCPPACGSLETLTQRMSEYSGGILLQTLNAIKDNYDWEGMTEAGTMHKEAFDKLVRQVRILSPNCMPLAAGPCEICKKCTYPDSPCRFPDRVYPSMEACGLLVIRICKACGLCYDYGPDSICYFSCILF